MIRDLVPCNPLYLFDLHFISNSLSFGVLSWLLLDLSSQIPGWNLSASRFSSVIPNRFKRKFLTDFLSFDLWSRSHFDLRISPETICRVTPCHQLLPTTTSFIWPLTRGSHPETRTFSFKSSHPDTAPAKLKSTSTSSVLLSNPSLTIESLSLAAIYRLSTSTPTPCIA